MPVSCKLFEWSKLFRRGGLTPQASQWGFGSLLQVLQAAGHQVATGCCHPLLPFATGMTGDSIPSVSLFDQPVEGALVSG